MKLTLKEQLIYLQLSQINYEMMLSYLNYSLSQTNNEPIFLSELSQRMNHIFGFKLNQSNSQTDKLLRWARDLAAHAIMIHEPIYPKLWYHIYRPPLIVYYRGDIQLLNKATVSIVGTRKITNYGKMSTQSIVEAMRPLNIITVSGLALGVDTLVHRASITNNLNTIAILPSGHEKVYPRENRPLLQQLYQSNNHLIMSEFLPWQQVQKAYFIMRNRLVAGLSSATIVIEAAKRSGSLITANYALQYNREVFALPGRISDSMSEGCNDLITAGATPITSIPQLIDDLYELYSAQGIINV